MEIDELFRTAAKLTTHLARAFVMGLTTGSESEDATSNRAFETSTPA